MNLLDQLEQVIEQEHAAMVLWDWGSLEACVQQKQSLAEQLSERGISRTDREQATRIRGATDHNVKVTATLSQQLSGLLSQGQRTTTYDRAGRVPNRPVVMMSYQG